MRRPHEIDALRTEARDLLTASKQTARLASLAQAKVDALLKTLGALVEYRAAEAGISTDEVASDDALRNEDERSLQRLLFTWSMEAGTRPSVTPDDTFERVVARLALDRGWSVADAARAILGKIETRMDIRDSAPRATVRRVHKAMVQALQMQLQRIDGQLAALDGGDPLGAAPVLLAAAVIGLVTRQEINPDDLPRVLRAEKERLAKALERRSAHSPGGQRDAQRET